MHLRYNLSLRKVILYIFCSWLFVHLDAQPAAPFFRHYSVAQGLPNPNVFQIGKDPLGRVWLGTGKGLYSFDGIRFSPFREGTPYDANIASKEVNGLLVEPNGRFWIGLDQQGLFFYELLTGKSKFWNKQKGLPSNNIFKIIKDSSGNIWIGCSDGLAVLRPSGKLALIDLGITDFNVTALLETSSGAIWVGTSKGDLGRGLFKISKEGQVTKIGGMVGTGIYELTEDGQKNIIVGTSDGMWLGNQSGDTFRKVPGLPNLSKVLYSKVSRQRWFATYGYGLFTADAQYHWTLRAKHAEGSGLESGKILAIHEDAQGLVWLGTLEGGLSIFSPNQIQYHTYSPKSPSPFTLPQHSIRWLVDTYHEGILMGSGQGCSLLSKQSSFLDIPSAKGKLPLYFPYHEPLWLGGNELYKKDGTTKLLDLPSTVHPLESIWLSAASQAWVANESGDFMRFDAKSNSWKRYSAQESDSSGLIRSNVNCFFEDSQKQLWAGTYSGLLKYEPAKDRWMQLAIKDHPMIDAAITTVTEDGAGRFWIGTYEGGLYVVNPRNGEYWHTIQQEGIIPSDIVSDITFDDNGCAWIATLQGMVVLNIPPSTPLAQLRNVELQRIDAHEGFPRATIGKVIYNDRKMWYLAGDSLIGVLTESLHWPKQQNKVIFSDFKLFNKSVIPGGEDGVLSRPVWTSPRVKLEWWENFFEVSFALPDGMDAARQQYEYRLVGFDTTWILSGSKRTATYTNLSGGTYTLQVRATSGNGLRSAVSSLLIDISPPFWKTWWFSALVMLSFGLLIYAVVKYRLKRAYEKQMAELETRKKLQEERERISRELHDNMGAHVSYIISHSDDSSEQAGEQLTGINQTARDMMGQLRESIWALNQEKHDSPALAGRLKQLLQRNFPKGDNIQASLHTDFHKGNYIFSPSEALHLLRVSQESLNNCKKYAAASKVELSLSTSSSGFTFSIIDNGQGMDLTEAELEGHYGLSNMKHRAEEIGANFSIESKRGAGTSILLEKNWDA